MINGSFALICTQNSMISMCKNKYLSEDSWLSIAAEGVAVVMHNGPRIIWNAESGGVIHFIEIVGSVYKNV